jgi:Domain of unknown function (DUF4296)
MRAGVLIVYISLLAAGCKGKARIPKNILPQAKMQQVLWDITRADLLLADYWLRKDSSLDRRTESIKLYQQIFDLHNISKEEFQQSFSFYKAHPLLFKPVLDSISAHANDAATELAKPNLIKDTAKKGVKPKIIKDTPSTFIHRQPPGQDTTPSQKNEAENPELRRGIHIDRFNFPNFTAY